MAVLFEGASAATFSDYVSQRLRADIVSGSLAAETKLAMKDLAARYRVGVGPLREALHRLAGEGLVDFIGQRGFTVPPLSLSDLEDLVALRKIVEETALRQALARGDDTWEAGIVAAFHLLEKQIGRFAGGSDETVRHYDVIHRAFHVALYRGVISRRLAKLHGDLFDQAFRYRKTIHLLPISPQDVLDEHRRVMEAVLERDVEIAIAVLHRHLSLTTDATRAFLTRRKADLQLQ